jgi:phosphoribosylaminoimidazolecarboxamide formyltransferase/IMP cyclohydrolase
MKTALISVSDKTGAASFAKGLEKLGFEILSTGGTAKKLKKAGVKVKEVSEKTKSPEVMDGRVKTLHPKLHAGILADRNNKKHLKELEKMGATPIDLVVVNFYPFEEMLKKRKGKKEMIENIDIGGPTMVRAAAKNHEHVTVVVDPEDYEGVLKELESGNTTKETREKLAAKAFGFTGRYDALVSYYFNKQEKNFFPNLLNVSWEKVADLRYGENPHQNAALYKDAVINEPSAVNSKQLQGKQLSYNNIIDIDSGMEIVREFEECCCVVLKHNNPCGVAVAETSVEAFKKALATDKMSAFGGVVAFNSEVDEDTAKELTSMFLEVIVAPAYTKKALKILEKKKRLRVMKTGKMNAKKKKDMDLKKIVGGLLLQDSDTELLKGKLGELKVVTERKPSEKEEKAMLFAWKVCKHVKSNSIIYALEDRTIGIGAGQMSRVDSAVIGAMKAKNANLETQGTALASDAFFPFRDAIDAAAKAGVTSIIQPGGSIRDQEVIDACNEHGIAMVFTEMRHFNH